MLPRRYALIGHLHSLADLVGDSDDITEGSTNLFFTNERAQDAVGGSLVDSSSIDFTYNDVAGTITAAVLESWTPTWTGNHRWTDNDEVQLGTGGDLRLFHDGTASTIRNDTGALKILDGATQLAELDDRLYTGVTNAAVAAITGALASASDSLYSFAGLEVLNIANGPALYMSRAQGTLGTPTAVGSGNALFELIGRGYRTSGGNGFNIGGDLRFVANQTFSSTAAGSRASIRVCPTDSVTNTELFSAFINTTGATIQVPGGAATQPGLASLVDSDTGLYWSGSNVFDVLTGGTSAINVNASQQTGFGRVAATGWRTVIGGSGGAGAALMEDTAVADGARPFTWVRSNGGLLEMGNSNRSGTNTTGSTVRAAITAAGQMLIGGNTTSIPAGGANEYSLQVAGTGSAPLPGFAVGRWSNNTTNATVVMYKSRGTSIGSFAAVQSGDGLGSYQFAGDDGTDVQTLGAVIAAEVDATVASNQVPGRLLFYTASTAGTLTERVRINSAGRTLLSDADAAAPNGFLNDTDTGPFRQGANAYGIAASGTEVARFDASATATHTRFMVYDVDNGTLERVTVGAADSGGTGFKVLRIPN
jgi:hypothetical protein